MPNSVRAPWTAGRLAPALPVPAGQALLADEAKARRSPINGTVVRPGQRVQVAGVLLALEAMTMETTIGDAVRAGAVLVAFA